jgi:acyl carrier protein
VSPELDQIKKWILARNPAVEDIEPDYDIIENRLIDSLSFVEFVFVVEQHSGKSIDLQSVQVDEFRTINAIGQAHFGVTTDG